MSLQTVVDNAESLNIDRRKSVAQQVTRSEIMRVTETPTRNPWRFNLTLPSSLRYSSARSFLESVDRLDRRQPDIIRFGSNPKLNWMFRYQGSASSTTLSSIRVISFANSILTLDVSQAPAGQVLFQPNDIIELGNVNQDIYPYPFTVANSQPVTRTASTISVLTHRPNFITADVGNLGITVGSNVSFRMIATEMPTYTLSAGGTLYNSDGTVLNNALLQWSGEFKLIEYTGDVA